MKQRNIFIFLVILFFNVVAEADSLFPGELRLQNMPSGATVTLETAAVWGTECVNYMYLSPNSYPYLYFDERTVPTGNLYIEFHADDGNDCEQDGDGSSNRPVIGYGIYRLSVTQNEDTVVIYLNYLDADYFGANYYSMYGGQGDVILTFNSNGWESSSGITYNDGETMAIWNEQKNPAYPPDGSPFNLPTPENLSVTWSGNHPKLLWEVNWGIQSLLYWQSTGLPAFQYRIKRRYCNGFKYLNCSNWAYADPNNVIIPSLGRYEFSWVDQDVTNANNDYRISYIVQIVDTSEHMSSSFSSSVASINGDFVPYSKQSHKDNISIIEPDASWAYPNPFNPETTLMLHLQYKAKVTVEVVNVRGEIIFHKNMGIHSPGNLSQTFNLNSRKGNSLPNGLYIVHWLIQNEYGTKHLYNKLSAIK